jgi:hypothetical protein
MKVPGGFRFSLGAFFLAFIDWVLKRKMHGEITLNG